jgi:hypothetical protein
MIAKLINLQTQEGTVDRVVRNGRSWDGVSGIVAELSYSRKSEISDVGER